MYINQSFGVLTEMKNEMDVYFIKNMENYNENIIRKLKEIDWHDIPVDKMEISINESIDFIIKVSIFNEKEQKYDELSLEFIGIKNFISDEIVLSNKSDLEIYSFDFFKKDFFECSLILLCGISEPDIHISLTCNNINLK